VLGPVLADEADLVLGCRDVAAHPDALPLHARLGNSLVLTSLRVLLGGSRFCGPRQPASRLDDGDLRCARWTPPSVPMPWSTSGVASETLRRCRALGLRTHMLPAWYDIDDAASPASLRRDLRRLPMSTAPHTRAAVEALDK
jgi:hypothetical protein